MQPAKVGCWMLETRVGLYRGKLDPIISQVQGELKLKLKERKFGHVMPSRPNANQKTKTKQNKINIHVLT
jgi:hypothetical protein